MTSHQVQVLNCRLLRCLCDANLKQLRSSVKSQLLESLSESNWAFYVSFTQSFRHSRLHLMQSSRYPRTLRAMPNGFIAVADLGVQSSPESAKIPADSSRFQTQFISVPWSSTDVQPMFRVCCNSGAIARRLNLSGYAVGKPEAWLELKLVGIERVKVSKDLAIQRLGPHSMWNFISKFWFCCMGMDMGMQSLPLTQTSWLRAGQWVVVACLCGAWSLLTCWTHGKRPQFYKMKFFVVQVLILNMSGNQCW